MATAADLKSRAKKTREIYLTWLHLFEYYHGGMPVGVLSSTAQWESNGETDAVGDRSLGEYGMFQVSTHIEDEFDLPRDYRKKPEGNIFAACLEYNAEAKRVALKYPNLIYDGTTDQWMLSRLIFSIGRGGTYAVMREAKPRAGGSGPFPVYAQLVSWANRTGAMQLGGQSAAKVVHRINSKPYLWEIAKAAGLPTYAGTPVIPPLPVGLSHVTLPKDLVGKLDFAKPWTKYLFAGGFAWLTYQVWAGL